MTLQLIAIQSDPEKKSFITNFKFIDVTHVPRLANGVVDKTAASQLKCEWLNRDKVAKILLDKSAELIGVERSGLAIVGSNGTLSRYADLLTYDANKAYPLVVFERLNTQSNGKDPAVDGFTVIDCNGRFLNVTMETLIKYAEQKAQLANARVVEGVSQKKYITAIKGTFNRVGEMPDYEKTGSTDGELKTDIHTATPVGVIDGYWPDGKKVPDSSGYKTRIGGTLTVEEKLQLAYVTLNNINPFVSSFLRTIQVYPVNIATCKTMGVDIKLRMVYNPYFVAELTLPELLGVLIHEVYHILFAHPARFETFLQIRRKGGKNGYTKEELMHIAREANMSNIAADLFVNRFISEQFNETVTRLGRREHTISASDPFVTDSSTLDRIPIKAVKLPDGGLFDDNVDVNADSYDTIFAALRRKDQQDQQKKQQQNGNNNSSSSQNGSQSSDSSSGEQNGSDNQQNGGGSGNSQDQQQQGNGSGGGQSQQKSNSGQNQAGSGNGSGSSLISGTESRIRDTLDNLGEMLDKMEGLGRDLQTVSGQGNSDEDLGKAGADLDMDKLDQATGDFNEKLKQAAMRAESATKQMGKGISNADRKILENILGQMNINWRNLLRNMMNVPVGQYETYAKHSKKEINLPGTKLPGWAKNNNQGIKDFLFCIDTSGSVGDEELCMVFAAMLTLMKTLKSVDVKIVWWGTVVTGVEHVKSVKDLIHAYHNMRDGGGTDCNNMFAWIANPKDSRYNRCIPASHQQAATLKGRPHGIVIFTDGYFDEVDTKYRSLCRNVLWLIHSRPKGTFQAPFGTIAYISDEGLL